MRASEPSWRRVLREPMFSRFIDELSFKAAPVDICMSRSCFSEYAGIHEDVYKLVKRLGSTSRLYTARVPYCPIYGQCLHPDGAISKVLVICCGQKWTQIASAVIRQYSHFAYVFSEDFYEKEKGALRYALSTRITSTLEHGGYYNVSFHNNQTILTMGTQTECLSCENSALRSGEPLRITRQVSLEGRELRVYCLHPYICERPTFSVLVDTLRHRKANLTTFYINKDSENMQPLVEAFLISSVKSVVYNPTPEVRRAVRIPEVIVPAYYDSFWYSAFAKRRHPMPKQAVLLLPFTGRVWLALAVTMGVCIAVTRLVEKVQTRSEVHYAGSGISHTLTALLLHQSCRLPITQRNSNPARLVIGLWALLIVVVSTGFKAALTSLLRDVPLEGRPLKLTSVNDALSQGYRHCWVTYAGDGVRFSLGAYAPVKRTWRNCVSTDNQVLRMNDSKMVYLMHAPSIRSHGLYTRQLYSNDYAPLPQKISPYLSGPTIRSNSRYRDAITSAIVKAFECGLFQRRLSLHEYKNLYAVAHEEKTKRPKTSALSFNDLKGCMLVGVYGSGIATLCLLAEVSLHIFYSVSAPFKKIPKRRLLFYKRTKRERMKQQSFTFQMQEIHISDL
ncbi:hypothetical protein MTO96_045125 [Rhipicephalus appendiculatus]